MLNVAQSSGPAAVDLSKSDDEIIAGLIEHFRYYAKEQPYPYHLSDIVVPGTYPGSESVEKVKRNLGSMTNLSYNGQGTYNGVKMGWLVMYGLNYDADYIEDWGRRTEDNSRYNKPNKYFFTLHHNSIKDYRVVLVAYSWDGYLIINNLLK